MYESLRYHEKRQGDFDKQINDYKKQVEELSRYRDDYNAVEELFNHEQMGNELLGVINKYNNVEPEQAVQPEDPNAKQLNELLSQKSNIEEQALNSYYKQQEDAQIAEIDQLASKYNLKYDKQQFIEHMNQGNIPREYWSRYFKSEALPTILEANSALSAENALKKSANAQSLATGANKQRPAVGGDSSYKSALDKILNQQKENKMALSADQLNEALSVAHDAIRTEIPDQFGQANALFNKLSKKPNLER